MEKRTITELSRKDGRVYVYLANDEIGQKFMQQAENEGYKFGDGVKPTERHCGDIMAVNHGRTINYVGTNGRIAFGAGAKEVCGERLIRVDFNKYISGAEDYIL